MLTSTPLSAQLSANSDDALRVLVVGAGIAGSTTAQLLRRRGLHPVLIDRATRLDDAGYMIALMPMVDRALDELGIHQEYRDRSTPIDAYRMLSHRGAALREDAFGDVLGSHGEYRGISRAALLEVLTADGGPVSTGTAVAALTERADGTLVRLADADDEAERVFDLVIIADGIRSRTRELVLGGQRSGGVVTGWGGWVVWAPEDDDPHLGEELWGDGCFVGSYPVAGAVGAFVGGPRSDTAAGHRQFVARIRSELSTSSRRLQHVLDAVDRSQDPFFWVLDDVRTPRWAHGRTILLGDAAAGFLPTAGIGAGMAIESAWMLSRTVAGLAPEDVPDGLVRYEQIQRPRVESAQTNSRQLAGLMFRRGAVLATVRDALARVASVKMALRPIMRLLQHPPEPPATNPRPSAHPS